MSYIFGAPCIFQKNIFSHLVDSFDRHALKSIVFLSRIAAEIYSRSDTIFDVLYVKQQISEAATPWNDRQCFKTIRLKTGVRMK